MYADVCIPDGAYALPCKQRNNKLTVLEAGVLADAPSLRTLSLEFNSITAIEIGALAGLLLLQGFYAEGNPIRWVSSL